MLGATAEVASFDLVDLAESLDRFQAFVLHRVPWGSDVGAFLDGARAAGKPVLFDTDDLVFDPAVLDHVAALEDMPSDEVRLYAEGLERYRRSLQECDAVIVSTSTLKGLAGELHPRVVVSPNVASRAMVEAGDVARTAVTKRTDVVTIGCYSSGTNTHKRDFLEAAAMRLLAVLESRPRARLLVAGSLPLRLALRSLRRAGLGAAPVKAVGRSFPALQAGLSTSILHLSSPTTRSQTPRAASSGLRPGC